MTAKNSSIAHESILNVTVANNTASNVVSVLM